MAREVIIKGTWRDPAMARTVKKTGYRASMTREQAENIWARKDFDRFKDVKEGDKCVISMHN